MKVVGVDPGLKGGISVIEDGKVVAAFPMPSQEVTWVNKTYNYVNFEIFSKILKELKPDALCIELVGALPKNGIKQGAVSSFNFGFSTGGIHGICAALGIPLKVVLPQKWKTVVLGSNSADKDDAIAFCKLNCPKINLKPTKRSKNDSDGMADAICIGIYGYRIVLTELSKTEL